MNKLTNPFQSNSAGYQLLPSSSDEASSLLGGVHHQIDDWVRLELTAEQMLQEELMLVSVYVTDELNETQKDLESWEWMAGQWLMRAADPAKIAWHVNGWWCAGGKSAH